MHELFIVLSMISETNFFNKNRKLSHIFFHSCLVSAAALGEPACPDPYAIQAFGHPEHCDQFFLCTNGTLTLETCENGLLFDGKGAVHNHCNYNWAVECGNRVHDQQPINAPACEYAFGIYPDSNECSTSYLKCEYAEPIPFPCDKGLVYDDRIHGCNWPDQLLELCNPEGKIFVVLSIRGEKN